MPEGSIDITGSGNFVASGVSNSTINASIVIGKSGEYRELKDHLDTLQKLFDKTPESETQERLELSEKINKQTAFLKSFEQDVVKLAETFDKIELNTDRLQKAKEYFDKGEITEARVLLEDAEEERAGFVSHARGKQKEYEEKILPGLQNASDEYLILAQTTALNFENPNRFEDTCRYYEQSIATYPFFDNLFAYAEFLQAHLQYEEAAEVYERLKIEFASGLSPKAHAMLLHNLARLHRARNEHEMAEKEYEEALTIRRKLAANPQDHSPAYLLDVAMTLNSRATLHLTQNEHETAEKEYKDALEIIQELAKQNPQMYLPHVAIALNNLALLHHDRNEHEAAEKEYKEALGIRRKLAEQNPQMYLREVATTLNNLATLHHDRGEFETAAKEYGEALEIRRKLAAKDPQAYLPDVAFSLNRLAILHHDRKELEAAEKKYDAVLEIRQKLAEKNPEAYLPDVATTLNSLAILHSEQEEFEAAEKGYTEALAIYRSLTENKTQAYLRDLATTLTNLANLHCGRNDPEAAEKGYIEALEIKRALAEKDPQMYLPDVATVLINLAIFYGKSKSNREKSIGFALEATRIVLLFIECAPYMQKYLVTTGLILKNWGMSEEEIMAAVAGKAE
jgi:hypothetical protein